MKIIQTVTTLFFAMAMVHHAQAEVSVAADIGASLATDEHEEAVDVGLEATGLRGHRELWRYEQNIACANRSNRPAYIQYIQTNDKITGGRLLRAGTNAGCVKMNCGQEGWKSVHDEGKKYAVCRGKVKEDGSLDFWIQNTNTKPK